MPFARRHGKGSAIRLPAEGDIPSDAIDDRAPDRRSKRRGAAGGVRGLADRGFGTTSEVMARKPPGPTSDAARRIATDAIARAHRRLRSRGDRDRAVHDARRAIRRVRALLALLAPSLGAAYDPIRAPLRTASHSLSRLRDAQTIIETLDDVAPGRFARLRAKLVRARDARHERGAARIARVHALLDVATGCEAEWLSAVSREAWRAGIERSEARARDALDRVERRDNRARTHRLRRRLRELALQLELLGFASDKRAALDKPARKLGRERDLLLLQDEVKRRIGDGRWLDAIRKKRRKLRRKAIAQAREALG